MGAVDFGDGFGEIETMKLKIALAPLACISLAACHIPGMPGGGTDIVAYPRLGGQHQAYIVEQLKAYQSGQRANAIMADVAQRMSDEDMKAVANFIQGLH